MRRLLLLLTLLLASTASAQTVTLLHFSDYHSHAVPFYAERGADQGGMARAVAYLRKEKARGALVFSGGDMMNKGAPAWSDKYGCAEWPWLNGIVDAMAFGNHEADYGLEAFEKCRGSVTYPILSANTNGFRRSMVLYAGGKRIGVFALAGKDFPQLVKLPGLTFGDPVAAARSVVRELRERDRVDAVVMIGHQYAEDDYELAREVPGIDVIFGTHSHLQRELTQIPGTATWFISPFQYLTYISRVELTFNDRSLERVTGRLVPVDGRMKEDRNVARRIRRMQRDLERDPRYRELFVPIGRLSAALTTEAVGMRSLEVMRGVAKADVALSTTSSYRGPLPAGTLTMESLRGAMPYDNEIVACSMRGDAVRRLLAAVQGEAYVLAPEIDEARTYRVATTDYLAGVAYRKAFACEVEKTGRKVRAELAATIRR